MKNKICTSIEQSKKLIELGLDVNTADMHHIMSNDKSGKRLSSIAIGNPPVSKLYDIKFIPAWSLSALMSLLPNGWKLINSERGDEYKLQTPDLMSKVWYDTLFEAVFDMIYWLLENKKL